MVDSTSFPGTPAGTRLAVLGSPIAHSQSPALHRAAYAALGLDWGYDAIDVPAGSLGEFLADLDSDWRGLSLTMPLKHEVLGHLAGLDRVATVTGSANTVLIGQVDGRRTLHGFNTDVTGLVRALAEGGMRRAGHVTVLGAGATAASAVVAAAELGAEAVEVLARTPAKAAPLVELGRSVGVVVTLSSWAGASESGRTSDLVISTLPGGVTPRDDFPVELRSQALLLDVSYSPWPSALASSWLEAAGTVISGLELLLYQAVVQVRIFLSGDPFEPLPGEDAVLAAMRGALSRQPVKE
ncbi:shikimate dehydrogenase [Cryobacterium algoritolerans]|uniref:Shikimate dehydrogenase n=1 Tax=Cryobacterium algoritolerans TaxID=1259184 RepID=A0A4R8WUJ1_9MICO|nr:shikimate dehydrogenase [Cryobacterium algoritolerans]TFC15377.1 shikimate dehydrogenase [Cryobacterium algoritolerans]